MISARQVAAALILFAPAQVGAQPVTRLERSRGFTMLDVIREDIEKLFRFYRR